MIQSNTLSKKLNLAHDARLQMGKMWEKYVRDVSLNKSFGVLRSHLGEASFFLSIRNV